LWSVLGPWWSGCAEKADYVQLAAESYHLPLKAAEPEPEAPPAAADSPSKGSDSPAADETPESKAGPAHSRWNVFFLCKGGITQACVGIAAE
jgi:hypothetical protein